ncbi:hypothetical protein HOLleu_45236 [Holothuria leucospilota]|uniref:Uncharacterized protein n=1 Tax=Holothuria leucospilota TaxID=206669 RepID=A0A9Q0Y954_HOLLE|nr:hypothetical protein HOLleu_45236 [Holothuria leucospilota]
MINEDHVARTVEKITEYSKQKGNKSKFGCLSPPLFASIPVHRVVPDTLHLFKRISDQLINHLLVELKTFDNIKNCSASFDVKSCAHIYRFESFIQSLGIEWSFSVDTITKLVTARDFTGPELWKIVSNISLVDFTPCHSKLASLNKIWINFFNLINTLKYTLSTEEIITFDQSAKKWVELFCEVYLKKDVTPYMHVLSHHVAESLQLNGGILSQLSQEGLEKLND